MNDYKLGTIIQDSFFGYGIIGPEDLLVTEIEYYFENCEFITDIFCD